MLNSLLHRYGKVLISTVSLALMAFRPTGPRPSSEQEWREWSNRILHECYDPSDDKQIRNWDLTLTEDHFLRLKRTFDRGKQEYFSFHLKRFNKLDYLGNGDRGILELKTNNDDIIVQTYDDPKGNVDSMATRLELPVKKMNATRLDSLREALDFFKSGEL